MDKAPSANEEPIPIRSIRLSEPGKPGQIQELELPVNLPREKRELIALRATAEFVLVSPPDGKVQWSVYLHTLHDGGIFGINGVEIASVPTSDDTLAVRHLRPFLCDIPAGVLRSGPNTLERQWSVRENQILVPKMFVGAKSQLEPAYNRHYFWQNVTAQVSFVLALFIALLMLGLFWYNRNAHQYFWIGISAMGWGILNFAYFMPPIPFGLFPYWLFLLYSGINAYAIGGWLFLLRDCNVASPRYQRLALGYAVLFLVCYSINYLITGKTIWPVFTPLWQIGLSVLGIYPVWILVRSIYKFRQFRHIAYLAIALFAVIAGTNDTLLMQGRQLSGSGAFLLQAIAPVWFIVVCFILISDFSKSLRAQKLQQQQLSQQLAAQRIELERLHAQERGTQEKHAADLERARIMQDMHDGLGSQLVSSLAMAQSGDLSSAQTYDVLRSCIDDLRLAIDTSSDSRDSLALALGNLRFRMEPRLKAAGITLLWNTQNLNDTLPLPAQAKLPLLRIIQESITNTLKHAGAKTLTVSVDNSETELRIDIGDNGCGFDVVAARQTAQGKGLNSLYKRARVLGAQLDVISSQQGTRTSLRLPLA